MNRHLFMRVAQIATFYGTEIAGAENSISLLLSYLHEQNVLEQAVFSTRGVADGESVHSIPPLDRIPPTIMTVGNPVLDFLTTHLLLHTLEAHGPFDLIHLQDAVIVTAGVAAAERLSIPIVVTVRDTLPRIVHKNNYPAPIAQMASLLLGFQDRRRLDALQHSSRIIAISNFVKGVLLEHGIAPERVTTIYNSVGTMFSTSPGRPQSRALMQQRPPKSAICILAAGRLCTEKGFHILLRALPSVVSRHPGVQIKIAGTGPFVKHLRDLATRLDLDQRVNFLGQIPFAEMASVYAGADMVVVPSVFSEPLGRTVLEAMSCGKTVIASAVGAIPELIEHGRTGWLIPPEDSHALSEAILRLLADGSLRHSLGNNARQSIAQDFNDARVVEQTLRVYLSLL
jgi:glycosyltransferase involved in cell wall biosynthesis